MDLSNDPEHRKLVVRLSQDLKMSSISMILIGWFRGKKIVEKDYVYQWSSDGCEINSMNVTAPWGAVGDISRTLLVMATKQVVDRSSTQIEVYAVSRSLPSDLWNPEIPVEFLCLIVFPFELSQTDFTLYGAKACHGEFGRRYDSIHGRSWFGARPTGFNLNLKQ